MARRGLLLALCLACPGCLTAGLGTALERDFRMAWAANAYQHANGRWPESGSELAEGACLAGVSIDREKLARLKVRPTKSGGISIHWTERDGRGWFSASLAGSVTLPAPEATDPTTRPATRPVDPVAARPETHEASR